MHYQCWSEDSALVYSIANKTSVFFFLFMTNLYVKAYLLIKLPYGDAVIISLISTLGYDVKSTFSQCSFNTIIACA